MESLLALILALTVVVLVIYLSYRFSRFVGSGKGGFGRSKYIKVLDRVQLGQEQALLVTKVGGKTYLMGTSSGFTGILAELSEEELQEIAMQEDALGNLSQASSFRDVLGSVLTKKKR